MLKKGCFLRFKKGLNSLNIMRIKKELRISVRFRAVWIHFFLNQNKNLCDLNYARCNLYTKINNHVI